MKFTRKQTIAFGIGAVGKDMVYALSANYVMYYYQDLLHLDAAFVGLILMIARIFDAFNDPLMGVLVARTNTRWGRFRPWLFSGTILNALVLYALYACPDLNQSGMMVFFSVVYILWGMTYTMMDIPFWSMIPAVTSTPKDREKLSVVGRTCAGIGSAVIQVGTMMAVQFLGGGNGRSGFSLVALIVALIFVVTELILCFTIKERKIENAGKPAGIREMFSSLLRNDQALVTVLTILLINSALYITSNLIIYFFKYDFGGENWTSSYTVFTMVGGVFQILGMMAAYPLLHKRLTNPGIFRVAVIATIASYVLLLGLCLTGLSGNLIALCVVGAVVFACNGILSVLTTVFLSSTADYGEIKTGHREESVIFSMQTFVVKAASGLASFVVGIGLSVIGLAGNTDETGEIVQQSASTILGLRLLMTLLPILCLLIALFFFIRRFTLTDKRVAEIADELEEKRKNEEGRGVPHPIKFNQ